MCFQVGRLNPQEGKRFDEPRGKDSWLSFLLLALEESQITLLGDKRGKEIAPSGIPSPTLSFFLFVE